MPAVAPLLFTVGFWVGVAQAVVVSIALGLISKALFKPKALSSSTESQARERMAMIRSSTEPHRIIVGQALVSGPIAFFENTGTGNEYIHIVVLLAGHECDSFLDYYFDDQLVGTLDGSGNVTSGQFSGVARIKGHLGTSSQAADSALISESDGLWTAEHKLSGIAYVYVRFKRDDTAFPNGIPQIRVLVKGKKFYDPRTGLTIWSPNWALAIRDYYSASYGLAASDPEISDSDLIVAANASDERVLVTYTSAAFDLSVAADTATFADDENRLQTGDGVVPATTGSLASTGLTAGTLVWYIRVTSTTGKFATSKANALAGTAINITGIGSGLHTLEPRAEVISGTSAINFVTSERFISLGDGVQVASTGTMPSGLTAGVTYYAIKSSDTVMQLASSYANALAVSIVSFSGGTGTITIKHVDQARYTVNGSYSLGQAPDDIMSMLLTAGAGVQSFSQGIFRVFCGVYNTPTLTITADDLRGSVTGTTGRDAREVFNAVRGTYVDQWKYWQPSDFPPIESPTYAAQDNDEQLFTDIDLPLVTDVIRAQRLAKITLERSRRGEAIVLPCKLTKFNASVWENAQVTISTMGYSSTVFRVTGWRFAWDENGPGVDISLAAEDSGIYTWSTAEADHPGASPDMIIPSLRTVVAPLGIGSPIELSLTAERQTIFPVTTGATTVVILVDWGAAPEPNGHYYEVQWKKSTDSTYQSTVLPFSGDTEYRIKETDSASAYNVRVRTVSKLAAKSAWISNTINLSATPVSAGTGDLGEDAVTTATYAYTGGIKTLNTSASPSADQEIQRVTVDYSGNGIVIVQAACNWYFDGTATDLARISSWWIQRQYNAESPAIFHSDRVAEGYIGTRPYLQSDALYYVSHNPHMFFVDTALMPAGPITYILYGAGGENSVTLKTAYVEKRSMLALEQKR